MSKRDIETEVEAELRRAGKLADDAIDIGAIALALARLDRPELDPAAYWEHLDDLGRAVKTALGDADFSLSENVGMTATALSSVLAGRYGYRGDSETYDDPRNANLMHVIDRKMGLPVSVGILYLHAARAAGLDLVGLNFPGHFVLRLQAGKSAVILDPFNGGQVLTTADLLQLIRSIEGPQAQLLPEAYAPVSTREILLRLQNNILSRALRAGELDRARSIVARMISLAPRRAGLQFELGRIEVHAGHMSAAAIAFTTCRDMASSDGEMRIAGMAEEALRRLKSRLN